MSERAFAGLQGSVDHLDGAVADAFRIDQPPVDGAAVMAG